MNLTSSLQHWIYLWFLSLSLATLWIWCLNPKVTHYSLIDRSKANCFAFNLAHNNACDTSLRTMLFIHERMVCVNLWDRWSNHPRKTCNLNVHIDSSIVIVIKLHCDYCTITDYWYLMPIATSIYLSGVVVSIFGLYNQVDLSGQSHYNE